MVAEVPEHATLNDAVEPGSVLGLEEAGFVKVSLPVVASGEHAVEDDHVEVEVWVQGGAEAVQEADRPELGVGGRTGTCVAKRGADRTQEDPEDRACDVRAVMQEDTVAQGIGLGGPGEEGLQVVLDDRVEWRGSWPSRSIRGRGGRTRSEERDYAARAAWEAEWDVDTDDPDEEDADVLTEATIATTDGPALVDLMRMGENEWDAYTRGSAMRRAGYAGLRRHVAIALGNWLAALDAPDPEAVGQLVAALSDDDPVVAEAAAWALGRIR